MSVKLFLLCCVIASSYAWLAPERCEQSNALSDSAAPPVSAQTVTNVGDIANKQHQNLVDTYKNHQFLGVPIRIQANDDLAYPAQIEVHSPYNCTFNTYDPRLLSTVACSDAACKLSHTVATTDTYTASEGYNWGAKISSKLSLFNKIFEIGGEVSTGGSYTCTYTKGRTTTDLVECSDNSGNGGHLQLYTIKTDMLCDFGEITYNKDTRDGKTFFGIYEPEEYFTSNDIAELQSSAGISISGRNLFLLDMDKITDRMIQKFMNVVPLYQPYTDLLMVHPDYIGVVYYKQASNVEEYRRIVPFTNEGGDSVYQYACIRSPL